MHEIGIKMHKYAKKYPVVYNKYAEKCMYMYKNIHVHVQTLQNGNKYA